MRVCVRVHLIMTAGNTCSSTQLTSICILTTVPVQLERPPAGFENECSDIQSFDFCCTDGEDFACTPVRLVIAATLISGL